MNTFKSIVVPAEIVGFVPADSAEARAARRREAERRRAMTVEERHQQDLDEAREAVRLEERKRYDDQLATLRDRQKELLLKMTGEFDGLCQAMKREIGEELLELSLRLAEVVLQHTLPDRAMMEQVIRETLEPISDLQGAKLRLSPQDVELFGEEQGALPVMFSDKVELVPDAALSPGDLLVESRNGYFNARLEERMVLLRERLSKRYRHDADE
jgi:flagellar biosynthesis/type III secretory pathway protein FliH